MAIIVRLMTGLLDRPTQTVTMLYVLLHLAVGRSKNLGGQTKIESHLITKFLLQWQPESGGVISHPAHSVPTPLNYYNLQSPSWPDFMVKLSVCITHLNNWVGNCPSLLTLPTQFLPPYYNPNPSCRDFMVEVSVCIAHLIIIP